MRTQIPTNDIRGFLASSVIAVPPLARDDAGVLDVEANRALVKHIEGGSISTLLYGGNANFYHIGLSEYPRVLELLVEIAAADTCVIPSVGPAYGLALEQANVLRDYDFPTVMFLPQREITTSGGIAAGIQGFVAEYGKPIVLYIKHDGIVEVDTVKQLVDDGLVSFIKYAVVRDEPASDDYLAALTQAVDPGRIVSGIGEQPAIVHLRDFHLASFTSGCVCVAPALSTAMLKAILGEDWGAAENFRNILRPLEDLRNEISPIRVLHRAVELAGIACTGPLQPLLSDVPEKTVAAIRTAAERLLGKNAQS